MPLTQNWSECLIGNYYTSDGQGWVQQLDPNYFAMWVLVNNVWRSVKTPTGQDAWRRTLEAAKAAVEQQLNMERIVRLTQPKERSMIITDNEKTTAIRRTGEWLDWNAKAGGAHVDLVRHRVSELRTDMRSCTRTVAMIDDLTTAYDMCTVIGFYDGNRAAA